MHRLHPHEHGCDLGGNLVTRCPDVHTQDLADELLRAVRWGTLERRQRDLVARQDHTLGLVPIDQTLDGVCRFLGEAGMVLGDVALVVRLRPAPPCSASGSG
jgi:hypothetical protein